MLEWRYLIENKCIIALLNKHWIKQMKINALKCKDTQKSLRLFDSSAKMFPTPCLHFSQNSTGIDGLVMIKLPYSFRTLAWRLTKVSKRNVETL